MLNFDLICALCKLKVLLKRHSFRVKSLKIRIGNASTVIFDFSFASDPIYHI